jgi:hypothetical protein
MLAEWSLLHSPHLTNLLQAIRLPTIPTIRPIRIHQLLPDHLHPLAIQANRGRQGYPPGDPEPGCENPPAVSRLTYTWKIERQENGRWVIERGPEEGGAR